MVLHLRDKAEYRKLQLFLDVLAIDDVVMEQVVENQNAAGRHNAAESSGHDVQPRAACPFDGPFRPAIWRRNASAFSKRSSVVLLLVEIIQLVAVNVHDEPQHIVDQGRKPCTLIP